MKAGYAGPANKHSAHPQFGPGRAVSYFTSTCISTSYLVRSEWGRGQYPQGQPTDTLHISSLVQVGLERLQAVHIAAGQQ
jgi:hypothetical protein